MIRGDGKVSSGAEIDSLVVANRDGPRSSDSCSPGIPNMEVSKAKIRNQNEELDSNPLMGM